MQNRGRSLSQRYRWPSCHGCQARYRCRPRSGRLGECQNPTVEIAWEIDHIFALVAESEHHLDPKRRKSIEDLVVKDHRIHEDRARRR